MYPFNSGVKLEPAVDASIPEPSAPLEEDSWTSLFEILREQLPKFEKNQYFQPSADYDDTYNPIADWLTQHIQFPFNAAHSNGSQIFSYTDSTSVDILRLQLQNAHQMSASYIESIRSTFHRGDWLCLQAAAEVYGIQLAICRNERGEHDDCTYVLPSGSYFMDEVPTVVLQCRPSGDSENPLETCFKFIRIAPTQLNRYGFLPQDNDLDMSIPNDDDMDLDERFASAGDERDGFDDDGYNINMTEDAMTLTEWRELVDKMSDVNKAVFAQLHAVDYERCTMRELAEALGHPSLLNAPRGVRFSRTFAVVKRLLDQQKISRQQIAFVLGQAVVVARDYTLKAKPRRREDYLKVQIQDENDDLIEGRLLPMVVVGFVQFGKTTNMALVSALLFDLGMKYIVLTAGRTVPLQRQGHRRFTDALHQTQKDDGGAINVDDDEIKAEDEEAHNLIVNEVGQFFNNNNLVGGEVVEKMYVGPPERDMTITAMRRILEDPSPIKENTLFVIKKNANIVRNMIEVIKKRFPPGAQVCWIDDECDELTLNTKKYGETPFHVISKELVASLGADNRTALYLGYTATVPACLLQPADCVFYPRYFSFLGFNSPTYQGLDTFFSPQTIATRAQQALKLVDFKRSRNQDPSAKTRRYIPITSSHELYKTFLERMCASPDTRQGHLTDLLDDLKFVLPPHDYDRIKTQLRSTGERNPGARKRWNVEEMRCLELEHSSTEIIKHDADFDDKIRVYREKCPWLPQFVFRALLAWSEIRIRRNRGQMHLSLLRCLRASGIALPKTAPDEFWNYWRAFKPVNQAVSSGYLKHIPAELFVYNTESPVLSNRMAESLGVLLGYRVVVVGPNFEELLPLTDHLPLGRTLRFQIEKENTVSVCLLDGFDAVNAKVPNPTDDDGAMVLSAFSHVGFRVRVHTAVCQLMIDTLRLLHDPAAWRHENLGSFADRSYFEMLSQRKKLVRQSEGDMQELLEVFEGPGATITRADELKRIAQHLVFSDAVSIVGKYSKKPPEGATQLSSMEDHAERRKKKLTEHWFVVGGEVFCRGITVPNLIVSLFGRIVTNQEQLLQFCRWFGHRKAEFRDLTAVICGPQQMRQFTLLWRTVSQNFKTLFEKYDEMTKRSDAGERVVLGVGEVSLTQHEDMTASLPNRLTSTMVKVHDPLNAPQVVFAPSASDVKTSTIVMNLVSEWLFNMLQARDEFDIQFINTDPKPRRKASAAAPVIDLVGDLLHKFAKTDEGQTPVKARGAGSNSMEWRGARFEGFKEYPKQGILVKSVPIEQVAEFLMRLNEELPESVLSNPGDAVLPILMSGVLEQIEGDYIDVWFASNPTRHVEEKRDWNRLAPSHSDTLASLLAPYRVERARNKHSDWDYTALTKLYTHWANASRSLNPDAEGEAASQTPTMSQSSSFAASSSSSLEAWEAQNSRKRKRSSMTPEGSQLDGPPDVLMIAPLSWLFVGEHVASVAPSSSSTSSSPPRAGPVLIDLMFNEDSNSTQGGDDDIATPRRQSRAPPKGVVDAANPLAASIPTVAIILHRKMEGGDLQRVQHIKKRT